MYRLLIVVALFVFGLALLGALAASSDTSSGPAAYTPPPGTTIPSAGEPIIGFAISLHHVDDIKPYLKSLEELAGMGFTSVEIVTPAFQRDGAAERIELDDAEMARPADVVALLQKARSLGMGASLMPIVLLKDPRNNEWRGKISPENWDKWWASYMRFSAHFLDLANQGGATSFSVGSELLTTEKMTARWEKVIAQARTKFHGRLYYSTNWDHYWVPTFWGKLDMIGINAYWDLTKGGDSENPGDAVLVRNWAQIREEVLKNSAKEGKPVLFTEVGFPSLSWGLKDPWNYVDDGSAHPAPELQEAGFRTFLNVWGELLDRPWPAKPRDGLAATSTAPAASHPMAGVYFYSWEPTGGTGPSDMGYGIRGKPTYDLLKQWLATYPRNAPTSDK